MNGLHEDNPTARLRQFETRHAGLESEGVRRDGLTSPVGTGAPAAFGRRSNS